MTDLFVRVNKGSGRLTTQVSTELREAIRSGRLSPGLRLPSTRALARDLEVSRGVVVEAYDQLTAEGFLVTRQGDGTRVALLASGFGAAHSPAEHPADGPWSYDLRPGIPDLKGFPRSQWLAAVRHVLTTLPAEAFGYPSSAGAPELRMELSSYLRRVRAAHVAPDDIVVMAGVSHGLAGVVAFLRERGEVRVAVESPGSSGTIDFLAQNGVTPVAVPVDSSGLDVGALERSGVRAVVVTPAHEYPTGVVLSPERRASLISWARSHDGLILEDDYDAEFRYDREPIGCLQGLAPEHVVLLGSVTKSLAPAIRIGWAVAPPEVASALTAWRYRNDRGTPTLDQHAFARFLATGAYDRHLRSMRRTYRNRRDALVSAVRSRIPGARIHGVSAGLHVYVEIPGLDAIAFTHAAVEAGVALAAPSPDTKEGLVMGYSRLPERRIAEAIGLLASLLR